MGTERLGRVLASSKPPGEAAAGSESPGQESIERLLQLIEGRSPRKESR